MNYQEMKKIRKKIELAEIKREIKKGKEKREKILAGYNLELSK